MTLNEYCFWKLDTRTKDEKHIWQYGCYEGLLFPGNPPEKCPLCGKEVCREVKE